MALIRGHLTEIVNNARTVAYADHMLAGLSVTDCDTCGNFDEVLGDKPYTSPLVDQPAWFDASNPDTWNFLGLLLLEAEGVEDSTYTSTVTQLAGDGAYASRPHADGREMRFRGVLLGLDDAAVQAGMTWLRHALEGDMCRTTGGCTGDHMCYLAACPQVCEDSPVFDPGGEVLGTNLAPNPRGRANPGQGWSGGGVADWRKGFAPPEGPLALTATAVNLCLDPRLRTTRNQDGGAGLWQYTGTTGDVLSYVDDVDDGPIVDGEQVRSYRRVRIGAGGADVRFYTQDSGCFPAAGEAWSGSIWMRRSTAGTVRIDLNSLPGGTFTVHRADAAAGQWVRVEGSDTAEVAGGTARLNAIIQAAQPGEVWDVVCGQIVKAPTTGPYGDGDWANGRWVGDPDGSVSVVEREVPDSPDGVGYQYATATADATGNVYAINGSRQMDVTGVTPGATYGARMQVFAPYSAPGTLRAQLRGAWRDTAGNPVPGVNDFSIQQVGPTSGGWFLLSGMTPPAPAGASRLVIFPCWIRSATTPPQVMMGQTIAWAARAVAKGEIPSRFWDGDSGDAGPAEYVWVPESAAPYTVSRMVTADQTPAPTYLCPSGEMVEGLESCVSPYERHMYRVSCIDGPKVITEFGPSCAAMWEVEFTLMAGVPGPFGAPKWVGSTDGSGIPSRLVPETPCPTPADFPPLVDPNCRVPAPPRPPLVISDCLVMPSQWRRYQMDVEAGYVPGWSDAVPQIQLRTRVRSANQVRLRFYPNPFGRDVTNLEGGCNFCGEFLISYIPRNSLMTIDGVEQQAWLETYDGEIAAEYGATRFSATHLLYGSNGMPMTWPLLSCGSPYAMTVDVVPNVITNLDISLCLSVRE